MNINPEFNSSSEDDDPTDSTIRFIDNLTDLPSDAKEMLEEHSRKLESMHVHLLENGYTSSDANRALMGFQSMQIQMLQKSIIGLQKAIVIILSNTDD